MGKLGTWYARLPASVRRAALVAGAVVLIAMCAVIVYRMEFEGFMTLFALLAGVKVLLTRAFAAWRMKGLAAAGKTLGIGLDETGTLDGRLRGIQVRVVPDANGKVKAFVSDGLGNTGTEKNLGDAFRPTTEQKIVSVVERLVSDAETAQRAICDRAIVPTEFSVRREAVRTLQGIPPEERIPRVDEVLALARNDRDPHVRLTASCDSVPTVDEEMALMALAYGDRPTATEAAKVLAVVGSVGALAPLVAARDRAPEAIDLAIETIRARTGVQAGGLAVAESLDADGAVSLAARAGALTVKSSS